MAGAFALTNSNNAFMSVDNPKFEAYKKEYIQSCEKFKESPADGKEEGKFDSSVQYEFEKFECRMRINCPDEDDDMYIQIKDGKRYAGFSLSLDEAEALANFIMGHVNNARISNPDL